LGSGAGLGRAITEAGSERKMDPFRAMHLSIRRAAVGLI